MEMVLLTAFFFLLDAQKWHQQAIEKAATKTAKTITIYNLINLDLFME